ncbi:MAG: hypothetical protein RLZZ156_2938, partial [Deinococcota bacterium]
MLLRLGLSVLVQPKIQVFNTPSQEISSQTALELAREANFGQLKTALFVVPDSELKARAFWLNLYNTLTLHAMQVAQVKTGILEVLGFYNRFAYQIGEYVYTLNDIEHGILRGNKAVLWQKPFLAQDPRVNFVLPLDPRIHFALNCGAASCPPIRAYYAEDLESQLEFATHSYLQDCKQDAGFVWLPRLFSYYPNDFGHILEFTRRYRPEIPA